MGLLRIPCGQATFLSEISAVASCSPSGHFLSGRQKLQHYRQIIKRMYIRLPNPGQISKVVCVVVWDVLVFDMIYNQEMVRFLVVCY